MLNDGETRFTTGVLIIFPTTLGVQWGTLSDGKCMASGGNSGRMLNMVLLGWSGIQSDRAIAYILLLVGGVGRCFTWL
jgi:hypothetical protein